MPHGLPWERHLEILMSAHSKLWVTDLKPVFVYVGATSDEPAALRSPNIHP